MRRFRLLLILVILAANIIGCNKKNDRRYTLTFTRVYKNFDVRWLFPFRNLPITNGRSTGSSSSFEGIAVKEGRHFFSKHDDKPILMKETLEGIDTFTRDIMPQLGVTVVKVDGIKASEVSAKRVISYRTDELAGKMEITLELNEEKTVLTCEIHIEELSDWAKQSDLEEMLKTIRQ